MEWTYICMFDGIYRETDRQRVAPGRGVLSSGNVHYGFDETE